MWRIALTPDEFMHGQAAYTLDGVLVSADATLDRPFEQQLTAYWVSRRADEPRIGGDDHVPPPYAYGEQA